LGGGGPVPRRVPPPVMDTQIHKHSVTIAGHSTSISLEAAFWDVLKEIAGRRGQSLNALIADIDGGRQGNLSSALRVFALEDLKARAR